MLTTGWLFGYRNERGLLCKADQFNVHGVRQQDIGIRALTISFWKLEAAVHGFLRPGLMYLRVQAWDKCCVAACGVAITAIRQSIDDQWNRRRMNPGMRTLSGTNGE
jgi:hypothetical protein